MDAVVKQRSIALSWSTQKLNMNDALYERHLESHATEADPNFPMPLTVKFKPKHNVRYSSRFRFTCEYGNSFDVLLEGDGTFEEHEHKPLRPTPR